MTQHIKLFLYLFITLSINLNCKKSEKNDIRKSVVTQNTIKKIITTENQDYEIWLFSKKNKSNKYKNIEILISRDSIKIFNNNTKKIVCTGEIIQTQKEIIDFTLGKKSAENLKSELNRLFNINLKSSINVIENADSDISKRGCLFPFYEMFITNNQLIIYDKEYIVFTKKNNQSENNYSSDEKYNINKLPFDFITYYDICYDNQKKCSSEYPSYTFPESKKILQYYGIVEHPTTIFLLPKINNFQPFILAYTESDVEGYYLTVSKKGEKISSLQIAQFNGESVKDFKITKDFKIELYSRKNTNEKRILNKVYKIQEDGTIK